MNLIANILAFLVIALLTGLGSAWYMVEAGTGFTSDQQGPWHSWSRVGRATADPYTRAHIARSGRLPVMAKSMLYYTTVRDSDGRKIDAECDYTITGANLNATWWSIAAYDGNGNLMPNPAARHAFNMNNVMRDPAGRFTIAVSANPAPGNWLPVDSDYQVRLIMRLYKRVGEKNPDTSLRLPQIRRVACR